MGQKTGDRRNVFWFPTGQKAGDKKPGNRRNVFWFPTGFRLEESENVPSVPGFQNG